MVDMTRVVEQIAMNKLLHSQLPFIGRTAGERILLWLFALFLTLGLIFLVFALYLWLKATQTPELAAALTGGAAVILALLLGGMQLGILWMKARKVRQVKRDVEAFIREVVAAANDEVGNNVRDNPKSSAILALVLGFLVGDRFL